MDLLGTELIDEEFKKKWKENLENYGERLQWRSWEEIEVTCEELWRIKMNVWMKQVLEKS